MAPYVQQIHKPAEWLQGSHGAAGGPDRIRPHYRYDVLETRHALETSTAWLAAQRRHRARQSPHPALL